MGLRFVRMEPGEIHTGSNVKETTKIVNNKKVIIVTESCYIIYKFKKENWTREDAVAYLKSLNIKTEKLTRHTEYFWTWRFEISNEK